jgi:CBS domain containing-hemolysin-like protein
MDFYKITTLIQSDWYYKTMHMLVVLLLTVVLLSLIALWVSFAGALVLTSRYELKKRAQTGDKQAKIIYGLTAGGREILVAMLLGSILAMALLVLVLQSLLWGLLAAILAAFLVVIFGIIFPFIYGQNLGMRISVRLAPLAEKILLVLRPIARPLAVRIDQAVGKKSILYSKEQLLTIIDDHSKLPYANITADEAKLVRNSLTFGQLKIADVMVPRNVVDMISVHDQVGPLVMDELHKSGHSRFPVYDPKKDNVMVGTLYLRNLVGEKRSGPVKKLMSPKVYFVHEELNLEHALDAFIKTKHHLFIVVNNFEEFVGILTIEDVLEQVLGRQIVDEFDAYENLRAVAELRAQKIKAARQEV